MLKAWKNCFLRKIHMLKKGSDKRLI